MTHFKRIRSAVEYSDIVQQHVIPFISCKRYLGDLQHAVHWLRYRDTMVQLMCNRTPEWIYEDDPEETGWLHPAYPMFDWADLTVEDINSSHAEGVIVSALRTGFDFAFYWGVQCNWFSGETFTRG